MKSIHIACQVRRTNIMVTLLGRGTDVDPQDGSGNFPLKVAEESCVGRDSGTKHVGVLLKAGTDEAVRGSDPPPPVELVRKTFVNAYLRPLFAQALDALQRTGRGVGGVRCCCAALFGKGGGVVRALVKSQAKILRRADIQGKRMIGDTEAGFSRGS